MTAQAAVGRTDVSFDEVYLAGSTGRGPALVGGLALFATERGITVLGPEPSSVRTMSWKRATTVAFRDQALLPDGRDAVTLEIEIDGSPLQFFVPSSALGGGSPRTLEERIASLAGIPTALTPPKPMGESATTGVSGGAGAAGPAKTAAYGPAKVIGVPALGETVADGFAPGVATSALPPGAVLAPATGGTLSGFSSGIGTSLQVKKRRRFPKRLLVAALVVLVAGGGTAAYVMHNRASTGSGSTADAVSAAAVNLSPGDLPGWKGVPGTTAGALGAFGYRKLSSAKPTSFASCTRTSVMDADAALSVLGFSEALPGAADSTAESSSPLFEDPAGSDTQVESSTIVMDSTAGEHALLEVVAGRGFPACYSRYLDTVLPALIGGTAAGVPLRGASVVPVRIGASASGDTAFGFSETVTRGGRRPGLPLSGDFVVVGRGRLVAVLSTVSARQFPVTDALKLLSTIEQNLADQAR
jgi:hypothetical protein